MMVIPKIVKKQKSVMFATVLRAFVVINMHVFCFSEAEMLVMFILICHLSVCLQNPVHQEAAIHEGQGPQSENFDLDI